MLIQPFKSCFDFSVRDDGETALFIVLPSPWNPRKTTKRMQREKYFELNYKIWGMFVILGDLDQNKGGH